MPPTFADLGVPDALCVRLAELGIAEPFPVQAATIPDALAGRDVCGKAPTGSGKTIAFGLPLLARVGRAEPRRPRALVLVPTRELAAQVEEQLEQLSAGSKVRTVAIYGGAGMQHQMRELQRGVEVVVATPGRLKDLLDRGSLRLDDVEIAVVDEADRMADMGFLPEVKRILDKVRSDRQTLLFSATLDGDAISDATHLFWRITESDRVERAADAIKAAGPTIVFCRTRHRADRVAKRLGGAGVDAVAIHGGRSQPQRDRALRDFTTGRTLALVATDVAARGIHVDDVAAVVHFDLPPDPKDYVHRSGRTARAGQAGVVVALVAPDQRKDATKLARQVGLDVSLTDPDPDLLKKHLPDVSRAPKPTHEKVRHEKPAREAAKPSKTMGKKQQPGRAMKP